MKVKIIFALLVVGGIALSKISYAEEKSSFTFGAGLGWTFLDGQRRANTVGALLSPDTVGMRFSFGRIKIEPSVSLGFGSGSQEGERSAFIRQGQRLSQPREPQPDVGLSSFDVLLRALARLGILEKEKTKFQILGGINLGFSRNSQEITYTSETTPDALRGVTDARFSNGFDKITLSAFEIGLQWGLAVEQYITENLSFSFDVLPAPIIQFSSQSREMESRYEWENRVRIEERTERVSTSGFRINLPLQAPVLRITLFLYF